MSPPSLPTAARGRRPSGWSRALDAFFWGAALLILALALWPRQSGPAEGKVAAAFDLPVVGGQGRFSHDGPRDKPLLVEVFASWCSACRRSAASLEALAEASRQGDLDVVAVSVDDSAAPALTAKLAWPIAVPVLHDERGAFQRAYGVSVLPTFVLIDRAGRVSDVHVGTPGASALRRWLRAGE